MHWQGNPDTACAMRRGRYHVPHIDIPAIDAVSAPTKSGRARHNLTPHRRDAEQAALFVAVLIGEVSELQGLLESMTATSPDTALAQRRSALHGRIGEVRAMLRALSDRFGDG